MAGRDAKTAGTHIFPAFAPQDRLSRWEVDAGMGSNNGRGVFRRRCLLVLSSGCPLFVLFQSRVACFVYQITEGSKPHRGLSDLP